MKAPTVQTQGTTGNSNQESMMVKRGLDMKAEMGKARVHISKALGDSIGTRFFRVVALGALLVGAAALYSSMSQGEAGSQPASSETSQWFEVEELEATVIGIPAYLSGAATQWDEVEELEAPVIGIPAPSSSEATASSPLSREQMAARVEAERIEDPDLDGMLFDMLMGSPAGSSPSGD